MPIDRRMLLTWVLTLVLGAAGRAAAADDGAVVVFAAASLRESMAAAASAWAARGHPRPVISLAATSALARQIEHGAPADLFVAADQQWMDDLEAKGGVAPGGRTDLVGNRLVLVAPAAQPIAVRIEPGFALDAALAGDRIAIADPDFVPAGRYARAALEHLGVWTKIQGDVVRADNVRSALALVERGEVAAGVVYRTDALVAPRVIVVDTFPADSHPPIRYPVAVVAGHEREDVVALRDFLLSDDGRRIFSDFGFTTP